MTTWNYEHLKFLVEQEKPQERYNLEFKPCDELRWGEGTFDRKNEGKPKSRDSVIEELSCDVSAMANSAGGIIIYGILENHNTSTATDLDHKPFRPEEKKARGFEWLDETIRYSISPAPVVEIIPVFVNDDPTQGWYYVVNVQQGITAHQAKDKRFYKRLNTTRAVMEQYEIVDVMNRTKSAIIDGVVYGENGKASSHHMVDSEESVVVFDTLKCDVGMKSINHLSAEYGSLSLYIFAPLITNPKHRTWDNISFREITVGNFADKATAMLLYLNWSAHQNIGVYPDAWIGFTAALVLEIPPIDVVPNPLYLMKLEINAQNSQTRTSWHAVIPLAGLENQWRVQPLGASLLNSQAEVFWQTYHAAWSYSNAWLKIYATEN
jgi:hypothetical protein